MRGDKLLGAKFPAKTSSELQVQKLVKDSQKAFTAKQFSALVSIDGVDSHGEEFHLDFVFTNTDPEFIAMLNDYGARLSGKQVVEEFMPIGKNLPPDGMTVIVKMGNGDELQAYRFLERWYTPDGFELKIRANAQTRSAIPIAYKPFNPKTETAL